MVKVYGGDPNVPTITVGRDRLKGFSADERKKAESLKNPRSGTALAAAIAARVADPYFDMLAGDKETKLREMQASLLAGEDPYLAALAESGHGDKALTAAYQSRQSREKAERDRKLALQDEDRKFKQNVKMFTIKERIKRELGPKASDYEVVVKQHPVTGEQQVLRIHAPTKEVVVLGKAGDSVKSLSQNATTVAPAQTAGTPETADPNDPAKGETVMGVPTQPAPAEAAPAEVAPAQTAPVAAAPAGDVPMNKAVFAKEVAKGKAKQYLEAPAKAETEEAARVKRLDDVDNTLRNLKDVAKRLDPNSRIFGIPGTEMLPEGSAGFWGSLFGNIPGTGASTAQASMKQPEAFFTFDKLMQLKESSKTGASGLGQVTAPELLLLKNSFDSFSLTDMEPEQVRENLARMTETLQVIRSKLNGTWTPEKEKKWRSRFAGLGGEWDKTDEDLKAAFEKDKKSEEAPQTRGKLLRKLD